MNNFELKIPNNIPYEIVEWIDGTKTYYVFSNEDGERVAKLNDLLGSEIGVYLTGNNYQIDFASYNKSGKYRDGAILKSLQPYSIHDEKINWTSDMATAVWYKYEVGIPEELINDEEDYLDESINLNESIVDGLSRDNLNTFDRLFKKYWKTDELQDDGYYWRIIPYLYPFVKASHDYDFIVEFNGDNYIGYKDGSLYNIYDFDNEPEFDITQMMEHIYYLINTCSKSLKESIMSEDIDLNAVKDFIQNKFKINDSAFTVDDSCLIVYSPKKRNEIFNELGNMYPDNKLDIDSGTVAIFKKRKN